MRYAQTRRARHFFATQFRGKIGLHQSDSPLDAALLRPYITCIRFALILFIHTPVANEAAGALPKPMENRKYDNVVNFTQKILWPSGLPYSLHAKTTWQVGS